MVPPTCPSKKNWGGQRGEGHGVVHHLQQEHHQSMKEGSHKKVQKIRMVQNGPPYLSIKKKFRWTARGRTWSSLQYEHHQSTWCTIFKMPGDDTEILGANTTPNHPPKPNQPLVNQLEVLEPSLGLDLIDSQSSCVYFLSSKPNPILSSFIFV